MRVMVLNDGETFTDLNGCKIVEIPDNFTTMEIEDCLKAIRDTGSDLNADIVGTFSANPKLYIGSSMAENDILKWIEID